jgi:hypothetical protein
MYQFHQTEVMRLRKEQIPEKAIFNLPILRQYSQKIQIPLGSGKRDEII